MVRSACTNALVIRLTSADVAPSFLATCFHVAVTVATSRAIDFACDAERPKYSATDSARSKSHVASSRLIAVVRTRGRRSVGVGFRS